MTYIVRITTSRNITYTDYMKGTKDLSKLIARVMRLERCPLRAIHHIEIEPHPENY